MTWFKSVPNSLPDLIARLRRGRIGQIKPLPCRSRRQIVQQSIVVDVLAPMCDIKHQIDSVRFEFHFSLLQQPFETLQYLRAIAAISLLPQIVDITKNKVHGEFSQVREVLLPVCVRLSHRAPLRLLAIGSVVFIQSHIVLVSVSVTKHEPPSILLAKQSIETRLWNVTWLGANEKVVDVLQLAVVGIRVVD
jgi:hypothetical protein